MKKRFGKVLLGVVGVVGLLVAGVLGRFVVLPSSVVSSPNDRSIEVTSLRVQPESVVVNATGLPLCGVTVSAINCELQSDDQLSITVTFVWAIALIVLSLLV